MNPIERRYKHLEMTDAQAVAQMRLADRIQDLRAQGATVACVEDPAAWDSERTPVKVCRGCPALEMCTDYAMTGAVTEGVIAGMWASTLIRALKAEDANRKRHEAASARGRRRPLPSVVAAA